MLRNSSSIATEIQVGMAQIKQVQAEETALPLLNPACHSRFWLQTAPDAKVCLFFHGFTAAPYQFEPLGQTLYHKGYSVLVPLQPGHGLAGGWNAKQPPPLPTDIRIYQHFALKWLKVAQSLNPQSIVVGGLSSGAVLAAWLSLAVPDLIDRSLLFAPYFSGANRLVDAVVKWLPIYFEWLDKNEAGHLGYSGFQMPALRIFLELGQAVLQQAQNSPAPPMLVVSSEADVTTQRQDHYNFFQAIYQQQPQARYHCFDRALKIPHTMMTEIEGNSHLELLLEIAADYLQRDFSSPKSKFCEQKYSGSLLND